MNSNKYILIILLGLLSWNTALRAGIEIIDIEFNKPNCFNDIELKVIAKADKGPLFYILSSDDNINRYNITGVFRNLFPGKYYLKVFNPYGEEVLQTLNLVKMYEPPSIYTYNLSIDCNKTTGSFKANAIRGLPPLEWKIYRNTRDTLVSNSNQLNSVSLDNYIIEVRDKCNNTDATNLHMEYYRRDSFKVSSNHYINPRGCNSINVNSSYSVPINDTIYFVYQYKNYETIDEVYNSWKHNKNLNDVNHGDTINIIIKNTCGDTLDMKKEVAVFSNLFFSSYRASYNWKYCYNGLDSNKQYVLNSYAPFNITIKDSLGNILSSENNKRDFSFSYKNRMIGSRFFVKAISICNNIEFYDTVFVEKADSNNIDEIRKIKIEILKFKSPTYDSTCLVLFRDNMNLLFNGKFEIYSPPKQIKSSHPAHPYIDTNFFTHNFNTDRFVRNLGPGKYIYRYTNDCGVNILDSFYIYETDVKGVEILDLKLNVPQKTCDIYSLDYTLYNNFDDSLYINASNYARTIEINGKKSYYNYRNYSVDSNGNYRYFLDTIKGTYEFDQNIDSIRFVVSYNESYNDFVFFTRYKGRVIYDTTIYLKDKVKERLKVDQIALANCNGDYKIEIKHKGGNPPFVYVLSNDLVSDTSYTPYFYTKQRGFYNIEIYDSCFINSNFKFYIDSINILPFSILGKFCTTYNSGICFVPSSFTTHKIIKPDGTEFFGDTLYIQPFTKKDVGLYKLYEYINLNGCFDSTYYPLYINPYSSETKNYSICEFDSIKINNKYYSKPGVYLDTFATNLCDSIITRNIKEIKLDRKVQNFSLCMGGSLSNSNKKYYQDTTYSDTFKINSSDQCPTIKTTKITVNDYERQDKKVILCYDDTFKYGNKIITSSVKYIDTVEVANCFKILTLDVTKYELEKNKWDVNICSSDSFIMNNKVYRDSIYKKDTFKINDSDICPTEVTLNLKIYPEPAYSKDTPSLENNYGEVTSLSSCLSGKNYSWTCSDENNKMIGVIFKDQYNSVKCRIEDNYGCFYECNYFIKIKGDDGYVELPSAFSPNGDGLNDSLILQIFHAEIDNFFIVNRWGEIIYRYQPSRPIWDGTYKGEFVNQGTYGYYMLYTAGFRKFKKTKSGTISVFR